MIGKRSHIRERVCVENDCPELCKIFCDVDHVIYASMKKVKFIRTGTLAAGDKACDFRFLNKKKITQVSPAD